MHKLLVVIAGPTAIGKTAKSIALAQSFGSEIISADSRQFYKEMSIGTAVPSADELSAVPHHFIQHLSIDDSYSVGDFEEDALKKINRLFQKHDILFMVGGSGLYIKAVTEGLDKFPKIKPGIREKLNLQAQTEGLSRLQNRLTSLDPEYAERIDLNNPHRVIRALEVCLSSGKPFSSFLDRPKAERAFHSLKIGLEAPREIIYERIERRVDAMIDEGLLAEAQKLYPKRKNNALNTVGYKELFDYMDGRYSLNKAIDEIKKHTRRYAKRQLTWLRKEKMTWFSHRCSSSEIENFIRSRFL